MAQVVIRERMIQDTMEAISCPFCGSDKLDIWANDGYSRFTKAYVHCKKCNACGPEAMEEKEEDAKEQAVRKWNQLARDDQILKIIWVTLYGGWIDEHKTDPEYIYDVCKRRIKGDQEDAD